jgi:hypothetical protein
MGRSALVWKAVRSHTIYPASAAWDLDLSWRHSLGGGSSMKRVAGRPSLLSAGLSVVLTLVVGLALALQARTAPARAQQPAGAVSTRAAAVSGFFAAEGIGDADAAVAEFAPNGIWAAAAATESCYRATPCTDPAGIRAQLLNHNISIHACHTIVELDVAGAVITGRMEDRNDMTRAHGVEHTIQSFLALVPQDKITYLVIVNDVGDPSNALNAAIGAGTQPAGMPIPNPATPCAGVAAT